ncbi:MAG: hypothetical protein QOD94_3208 [Alphaproteobacteria bacterium]|nr:hypothetical protein [Alphaproteobacteria bacterium]
MRLFARAAGLCAALLATAHVERSYAGASEEVRLFIGVTHEQLDNKDDQVRAFIVLQNLLSNIQQRLPSAVRSASRLGDVAGWKGPEDRKKLEQLNFTHYLLAEPRVTREGGVLALEVKWHIGMFSTDENRALDGWLKEKTGEARYLIFIPKIGESQPDNPRYEETALKRKKSGTDGAEEKDWENAGEKFVEDLIKIIKHVFPEMRSSHGYFIQCIENLLRNTTWDGVNMDVMTLLSAKLRIAGWHPTVPFLGRPQAEEICADKERRYTANPNYRYEDADFLITGWLTWGVTDTKVRPSIQIDNRVAEKRKEYVALASDPTGSGESLDDFCVAPGGLLQMGPMNKLVEYIRGHGFKAGAATPLHEDWRC